MNENNVRCAFGCNARGTIEIEDKETGRKLMICKECNKRIQWRKK